MNNKVFDVPVLLILFARKDTALKVIDAIAEVKPKRLYISQDGPRNKKEEAIILDVRKAVLSKINWDCELTVWTHDKNLGLRKHVPEAFDKFFINEEYGIYLEDDTLPSTDFFYFQKELLEKYKNDKRIFSINGTNFYPELVNPEKSYYFSKIGDIWGFGMWKRSWKLYDPDLSDFKSVSKTPKYKSYFFNLRYKYYLETFWKAIINKKLDSWAMQLVYAAVKNDKVFIAPKVNMVNNIGVANTASNPSLQYYHRRFGSPFPLIHPTEVIYNKKFDMIYFRNMLKGGWIRIILSNLYFRFTSKTRKVVNSLTTQILKTFTNNDQRK